MREIRITTVVGARPQFVKAAVVSQRFRDHNREGGLPRFSERIIHTGQHYDRNLSQVFFSELEMSVPAVNLGVGSGLHGQQTGRMVAGVEVELLAERPDWVLVYGDTNSTLAAALAAAKLGIPVAHVEAGVRALDRRIPEEINRVVTDTVATLLFCPTSLAVGNLRREGITAGVHLVGDVMYSSFLQNSSVATRKSQVMKKLGLKPKSFYLGTIHRANNTDDGNRLRGICKALHQLDHPLVLPLHPRTREAVNREGVVFGKPVCVVDPVSYFDMLVLEENARLIITDSGGVMREAYWLNVPCVVVGDTTEWPELLRAGCSRLVKPAAIVGVVKEWEDKDLYIEVHSSELLGDGSSGSRIVKVLAERVGNEH